ncbi:MAG: DUF1987 domain-containing protein [Bacteroidales bacterium]|jgi:hypothetical protein|nr:DUF1987 domain-containing protein [Bacteroidales bacterium]
MESIRIEKTSKSPLFVLKDGFIGMTGRSTPQNARQLYQPCFNWMNEYVKKPLPETRVDIYFEYVDSASIRCVVDLLLLLEENKGDARIEVNWYYEIYDEDMHELGTYIQTFLKFSFNFIVVEEHQNIII